MRIQHLTLIIALLVVVPAAQAQDRPTTVRIMEDGVFLNGQRLRANDFPPSLKSAGQTSEFTFSGDARFYVNGRMYAVEGARIVELPQDEDDSFTILFRSESDPDAPELSAEVAKVQSGSPMRTIRSFARVLDDRADRIESLSREFGEQQPINLKVVAESMRREAEESAVMMRAFPRIELQSYLEGLHGRDSVLYDRLMQELQMESETARLAAAVQTAENQDRRRELERTLRSRLDEIFELKQQNRQDEIRQLEKQLQELRSQLEVRESNRRAIIERRLEELVGPLRR